MKKILSFALAIMLLIVMGIFPSYAAEDTDLAQNFYDYCVEVLPADQQPVDEDKVYIYETSVIDGLTFFSAKSWTKADYTDVERTFGEWKIFSDSTYTPYDLGIYISSADEIYTLDEAYNSGWITDVSALKSDFNGRYTFYQDYISNPENKYESEVVPKVFKPNEWTSPDLMISYKEVYEYYSGVDASTDEATPDYVLIYCVSNIEQPMLVTEMFGDYAMTRSSMRVPFTFGYCVYIPATKEVLSLSDAYSKGVEGIDKVFTDFGLGRLMGDMDKDRKLTVKDATYIQKMLAGIEGYPDVGIYGSHYDETLPSSISDFNRDRAVNIKDATDIQKRVAGMT